MLRATDLTREFGTGDAAVTAIGGVSLVLDDGVFAAIVGPSGSGKSTLLSLLGTLDAPTSGTVLIDGRDVTAMSGNELTAYRRSRIGFVFQSYNLVPNLSAIHNVMLPMEFAGVPAPERRRRAEKLLAQVGLDAVKQARRPGRLSGGEQQRVAIARALANKPCLILADEPTGNLDSETGARVVDLLRELARSEKTTVIAVTHDLEMAAQADVTYRLTDGRLVDADAFDLAVADANSAYKHWLASRSTAELDAFVSAVAAMIEAAPAGRRLAPEKIRARFADASGEAQFEALLAGLGSHDLFEDPE